MATGSYETSFLDAVVSNFLMTLILSLPPIIAVHFLVSLPKLLFSHSLSFLHYTASLFFWLFLLFLLCISFVRKLERTEKTFLRLIEETTFSVVFFYGITPGPIFSLFGILTATAAGISFVSHCSDNNRSSPSENNLRAVSLVNFIINRRPNSTAFKKLLIWYFSIFLSGHFLLKFTSLLFGIFYYRFFAITQFLQSLAFFILGFVISKITYSIFEFFFSEKNFKNVAKSGSILLSGLQNPNRTIQYFALHELFSLGMFDELKRKRIFSEIEYTDSGGEVVVSREIVREVTKFFDNTSYRLERDMRHLRKFIDCNDKRRTSEVSENIYKSDVNRQRLYTSPPPFLKPINRSSEKQLFPRFLLFNLLANHVAMTKTFYGICFNFTWEGISFRPT